MTLPVILPLKYVNVSKSRLGSILGENKTCLVIALIEDMISLLKNFQKLKFICLQKRKHDINSSKSWD